MTYGDRAIGAWHTHPGVNSNLTKDDMASFLAYPDLEHYIVGTDGVTRYLVRDGKVIVA